MRNEYTWIPRFKYELTENDSYKVWLSGVFCYDEASDILETAKILCRGNLDFNKIHGFFRLIVLDKSKNSYILVGDNSGSQYFYFDESNKKFSDSFIALRKQINKLTLDYSAISELFTLGAILGEDTIVKEIKKTDSNYYFIVENNCIKKLSKKLVPFNKLNKYDNSFGQIMRKLLSKVKQNNIGTVLTGGTDSRVVLSFLHYADIEPELFLTGRKGNPDVPIAENIADKLDLKLEIIDPDYVNDDKLKTAYFFLDGAYDAVLAYRHYLKSKSVVQRNILYEFGGLGGEFYKNDTCHPIIYGLRGYKSHFYYYETILKRNIKHLSWLGKDLIAGFESDYTKLFDISKLSEDEPVFLSKCNRVFFELLKARGGSITNGYSSVCCKVDPLMDRNLIAVSSQTSPLRHDFKLWQKKLIDKYCKKIANIRTDQGYTCSLKFKYLLLDVFKQFLFNFKRLISKIKRNYGLKIQNIWDMDYINAKQTNYWKKSFEFCKANGIIDKNAKESDIPVNMIGNIILIGMTFDNNLFK
ncbi:MAG: hypothetical protein II961_01065 [Candidatus Riflebacteria bacterium]|nr:hypothetical protein [Candidatus Riflebacteria bacterium]